MTLYDILRDAKYTQQFSVYITNDYDQNILIGRGTRPEMLDEHQTGGCVFDHLMDNIDRWVIRGERMIVFVLSKRHKKPFEKYFLHSDEWGHEPNKRPWRYSIETEEYTDDYIKMSSL